VKIVVPMPPNLTNRRSGGSHWRTIHREKKAYQATLDLLQLAGKIPRAPDLPPARITLRSTMYLGAHMDVDNAMARHKPLCDWLATRGFVVNDRDIHWLAFPTQIVKRGQDYRIELDLEAA
jgi:hypothetical protein